MKRQPLPLSALRAWSRLNAVELHGVEVQHVGGSPVDKGSTVVASQDFRGALGSSSSEVVLVRVPRELILSAEMVAGWAKVDACLREVLEVVGDFAKTDRGSIMVFLIMQLTISSLAAPGKLGVAGPWSEYVRILPSVFLPTCWAEEEQDLLVGTSLQFALPAKLNSLSREFQLLRESTERISWCEKVWWNDKTGCLDFQDWLDADAWYRSRVLHLPEVGNAMVPCIDMVNHRSSEEATAYYDQDSNGDAALLLRDGKNLSTGQEASINYGCKGAAEMVFSYGFIDESMTNAREVVLDLEIPLDDPLKKAKEAVSESPPAVRFVLNGGSVEWQSSFVWLICVNEEDGLAFKLLQSVDGCTELQVFWKGECLEDISSLEDLLKAGPSWGIFQLRAVSLLQERVENQLMQLDQSEQAISSRFLTQARSQSRSQAWVTAMRLRELEKKAMENAIIEFERQKDILIDTDCVRRYLSGQVSGHGKPGQ
ncbi:MAG: hypothetical protein M1839_001856 [Geoglossum umbratile]|nr:MAG: hypothetical protein M1839_001856 [Geoglossum umbratile]